MAKGQRIKDTARRTGLLALAALGLHQLRYIAGYGSESGSALAHQGHDYLAAAMPKLAGAAVLFVGASLAASALRHNATRRVHRPRSEWLRYSFALLAIFVAQELVESWLSPGHPDGLAAVLGARGWLTPLLALLFGAAVAISMRVLDSADVAVTARRHRLHRRRASRPPVCPAMPDIISPARSTLAFGFARRPPPAILQTG
ncbi:MAG: hypothetical protein WDZ37_04680 [Solirubrobacterales bacterium]